MLKNYINLHYIMNQYFIPVTIRDAFLKKYQPSSIKTMDGQIKRLFRIAKIQSFSTDALLNFANIIDIISNINSSHTVKKGLINSVMKCLQYSNIDIPEQYTEFFKQETSLEKDATLYAKPTDKEKQNMISFDQIIQKREYWKTKAESTHKRNDYIKYLVLSLYTIIPPLRGEDYFNTVVLNSKGEDLAKLSKITKHNFYDTFSHTLVLSKYKTVKSYGLRLIKFPKQLADIVDTWMNDFNNTEFLIPNRDDLMMSQQSFTDLLLRIFSPLRISTVILRKIYITQIAIHLPIEQRKEIARIMGHSIIMQEFIYNKSKE